MGRKLKTFEDAENYCLSFISPDTTPKRRTLARIKHLMQLLGNPQKKLHVIHVTGSYGKSSTAYMIASILEYTGQRVGLHMKPHLQSITERMCINRIPMPDETFISYVNKIKPLVESMDEQPTYFELLVAIMLLYFSNEHVDVAVIEAGRGGRLDATNICNSSLLVLTNVYLVHTDILGKTHKKIVQEKMGLARKHIPLVSGVTQSALQTFIKKISTPLAMSTKFFGKDFNFFVQQTTPTLWCTYANKDIQIENIPMPFMSESQLTNASLAICAAKTYTPVQEKQIVTAFSSMKFPGRMEIQKKDTNTIIMDSAHNIKKMTFLLHDVQKHYPDTHMTVILRINNNTSEIRHTMKLFQPIADGFILVTLNKNDVCSIKPSKTIRCLSLPETLRYINTKTNTTFLITSSMKLIGKIQAGLSFPYQLK